MHDKLKELAAPALLALATFAQVGAIQAHEEGPPHCVAEKSNGDCSFRASLQTLPKVPRSGEPASLEFTLTDGAGAPLVDLLTHHARRLHVLVIGADMEVLGHIHPQDFREPVDDGRGKVYFTFPRPGRYLIAADALIEEGPRAARFVVDVVGTGSPRPAPEEAAPPSLRVVHVQPHDRYVEPVIFRGGPTADGYAVELESPDTVRAGEPASLVYRFTRHGAPLTDLRPFLAAPMHLAVVKDDLSVFLHEHGTVAGEAGEGHHTHGSSHTPQHTHGSEPPKAFGPGVTASVEFPEAGTYYLFGQAAVDDDLLMFRFPLVVE